MEGVVAVFADVQGYVVLDVIPPGVPGRAVTVGCRYCRDGAWWFYDTRTGESIRPANDTKVTAHLIRTKMEEAAGVTPWRRPACAATCPAAIAISVPSLRWKTTAFLHFADLAAASEVVPAPMDLGARAVKLMDNLSLRATRATSGAPDWMHEIGEGDAGLLVEFRTGDQPELDRFEEDARKVLDGVVLHGGLTRDSRVANGFWTVRKGVVCFRN